MERFIANQVNESLETIEDMCFVLKQSIEQSKGQLNFTLETDRAPNRSIKCRNCDNDKIEKFIISNRDGNLTCTVCGTYNTNQHILNLESDIRTTFRHHRRDQKNHGDDLDS